MLLVLLAAVLAAPAPALAATPRRSDTDRRFVAGPASLELVGRFCDRAECDDTADRTMRIRLRAVVPS